MLTESQRQKLTVEWSEMAKETVEVDSLPDFWYAKGSELAVLRLYAKYRGIGSVAYRSTVNSWVYTHPVTSFAQNSLK